MKKYRLSRLYPITSLGDHAPINSTKGVELQHQNDREDISKETAAFIVDDLGKTDWRFITPDHPGLYYIGRIDNHDQQAPVLIWQGTEVRTSFTGKNIGFRFSGAWGQNYFNVIIDGSIKLLKLKEGATQDYLLAATLPEGTHHLILYKRSEAMFGNVSFRGLILEKGAVLGSKPEPLPLRIEFYGDSITAGACNEDLNADQYEDSSTHNNYLSYAAITARSLNAEHFNIAVSGTGLCYSWNPILMPEVYDKLYPDKTSGEYVAQGRKPDIVLINLGQNDYGYPNSLGLPFPVAFTEKYLEFVRNIRVTYPDSHIVCAIGGMTVYHESEEFRTAFEEAVAELKTADHQIYSLTFNASTANHPRVDTHAKLAAELTAFLKRIIIR